MEQNIYLNKDFLTVLKSIKISPNPFDIINTLNAPKPNSDYNHFGFPEDIYDFEIKCPICLGRVKMAKRPDKCYHIFCGLCIKEWSKNTKKCPCCRKEFKSLIKVSYSESWVSKKFS